MNILNVAGLPLSPIVTILFVVLFAVTTLGFYLIAKVANKK